MPNNEITIAPSASYHFTELGIKDPTANLARSALASPLVGIRQTGFEDGNEIETETDEGHTGVANLDMGSYRTTAESAPSWEDGVRYGQGIEDYAYLLLPDKTIEAYEKNGTAVDGVYAHHYEMAPDTTNELPFATIYHGYNKTTTDGRIFNNAMMNEFEFTMAADEIPKANPTFISDYNYVNCTNPAMHLLADHLARTAMAQHTSVYVAAVGADEATVLLNPINCFQEASFTVNHNMESQSCHNDNFGENTKTMGARELEGSITMPWVDATKYFETEYEAYDKYGHVVSEYITQKQIWFVCEGGDIHRTSTSDTLATGESIVRTYEVNEVTTYEISTGIPFKLVWKIPVAEVTNVTSSKSGDEAKDLTFEFKGVEQSTQSYLTCDIVTDLPTPHLDATGTTKETYYASLP